MNQKTVTEVRAVFRAAPREEEVRLDLVFDVLLYFKGPPSAHWDGILAFYRRVLPLLKPHLTHYVVDGRAKLRKIDGETYGLLEAWSDGSVADRTLYGLCLQGGAGTEEAPPYQFDFYSNGAYPGYVRLSLPADEAVAQDLRTLVLDLVRTGDWWLGTAGFGVSVERDFDTSEEGGAVYSMSRRFEGVEFGIPHMFSKEIRHGLKSVNWFTVVSDALWAQQQAGSGRPEVVDPLLEVHRLKSGIAVQAGPEPLLGDVNRQDRATPYRAADRALRGVRLTVEQLNGYDEIGGEDNTARWLTRFET